MLLYLTHDATKQKCSKKLCSNILTMKDGRKIRMEIYDKGSRAWHRLVH